MAYHPQAYLNSETAPNKYDQSENFEGQDD